MSNAYIVLGADANISESKAMQDKNPFKSMSSGIIIAAIITFAIIFLAGIWQVGYWLYKFIVWIAASL
jgi:hypothetical protein